MSKFDVYRLDGRLVNFVIDVQSEVLSHLDSRVVVPLYPEGKVGAPLSNLNPAFDIEDARYVFFPQQIATIQKRMLRRPITSLAKHQDEITRALDLLLTGF